MTVRERRFRPFTGTPTSDLARVLVLPRYAWREVFSSKALTGLFTSAFVPPLGAAVIVWLKHNVHVLAKTPMASGVPYPIDERFFGVLLIVQAYFAFSLAVLIGPTLVSPDLVNGGLPLYLSRPLSRWQYVAGKALVLAVLLSAITWAPLSVVFLLDASLEPGRWLLPHAGLGLGILAAGGVLVLVLSLVPLALSAWVRNRAVARGLFLALAFVPTGLGRALNRMLETEWGGLVDPARAYGRVLEGIFGTRSGSTLPLPAAWLTLLAAVALSLFLLQRKLRACEVVR